MLNRVIQQCRLTGNPETRFLQGSNSSVTRFSIAVQRDYKEEGEQQPKADFFNCVAWNRTGENIEKYFAKGSMIIVEGRLESGSYTDRDGKKVYTTDIVVNKAYFAGEKRQTDNEDYNYGRPEPSTAGDGFMNIPDGIDEELPFN